MGAVIDYANANRGVLSGITGRGAYVQMKYADTYTFVNPITGNKVVDKDATVIAQWTEINIEQSSGGLIYLANKKPLEKAIDFNRTIMKGTKMAGEEVIYTAQTVRSMNAKNKMIHVTEAKLQTGLY